MRNSILGVIAGLLVGTVGTLAYSHYTGDGDMVSNLQAKLDEANADLAKLKAYHVQTARQSSNSTVQNDALAQENADLRKQLDDAKEGAPVAAAPPAATMPNISTMAGLMMGMMRGGGGPFQAQQRLFTMQARLKLTPEQSAKIKAAMDADNQARREMMRQRFGGGRGGPGGGGPNGGGSAGESPATPATMNNLQKTLASVLNYQQQADYLKLQSDEKAAQAETAATSQVNGVMPLLQLSDSQKEAAMQALYQVQLTSPDANAMMASPNPIAAFGQQAQATQSVLAKVLTPDQMTLYQAQSKAQAEAMAQFGQGRQNRQGGNGGGGGGGNTAQPGGVTIAGQTGTAQVVPATISTSTNAATATTPAATTNADGTPATPAASTNAAPVTQ